MMPHLAGKKVGSTGFGLMSLTQIGSQVSRDEAFKAMRAALEAGANLWNGAEFYGPPDKNSLVLLREYYERYPEDADKVVLSVKGCLPDMWPDNSPENARRSIETCLDALGPKGKINIFGPARIDPKVPLETTIPALHEFMAAGKIGAIGLSEVSAKTIRSAAEQTKIASVEVELSLWCRDIFRNGVTAVCAEYDIPILAYSPLGKGIFAGRFKSASDVGERDFRRFDARLQAENFSRNLQLAGEIQKIADRKGCSLARLSIAWVRQQSQRSGNLVIIPIPGASRLSQAEENFKEITLTEEELERIDQVLEKYPTAGPRNVGKWAEIAEG